MASDPQPITRDDIESKFVELQRGMDSAADSAKSATTKIGIAAIILVLILAFLLGRKRGSQSKTVVEIRRL